MPEPRQDPISQLPFIHRVGYPLPLVREWSGAKAEDPSVPVQPDLDAEGCCLILKSRAPLAQVVFRLLRVADLFVGLLPLGFARSRSRLTYLRLLAEAV
jgi:hypothetical protein